MSKVRYISTDTHAKDCTDRAGCRTLALHFALFLLDLQKLKSILIRLVSTANTGYFYATTKNPTNVQHKLALMKVRGGHN